MKRSMSVLIVFSGITGLIVCLLMDQSITELWYRLYWSFAMVLWTFLLALNYAVDTRREVNCRCFEEVKE